MSVERSSQPHHYSSKERSYIRHVLMGVCITLGLLLLLVFTWYTIHVLLLLFAAILLAIVLRSLSEWITREKGLPPRWSLFLVVVALVMLFALGSWLIGAQMVAQTSQMIAELPPALEKLKNLLAGYGWGQWTLEQAFKARELITARSQVLYQATGALSAVLWALANTLIIFFVGLYLAIDARIYLNGFVKLIPIRRRERTREVLAQISLTLRWWLVAKFVSMAIIGVLTTIGLWLMGVPLALALGVIAALLTFIPNMGPVLSAIPAVLFAWVEEPGMALQVGLLYLGIQTVETYFITPFVEQKTIALPPALIITAQVLLGIMVGFLGVTLATPLLATLVVIVKMLYVEDTLGDKKTSHAALEAE